MITPTTYLLIVRAVFPLNRIIAKCSEFCLFREHSDRTNVFQTRKCGAFPHDTVEAEDNFYTSKKCL